MQAIIFVGIQASGKSSFYKEKFFNTHLRISLDMLNTRNKEQQLLHKCMELQQRIVIDNTNPLVTDRVKYIEELKAKKYKIIGYYFQSNVKKCLERNSKRVGKNRIPDKGILATYKKMELPTYAEGFDELYYIELKNGQFIIQNWTDEIH